LQGVLESEVGAVTGGRRAPAVLAKVRSDLDVLRTSTGKSKGALKEAEAVLEAAKAERELAEADLRRFGETLDRLERKRGELRRLKADRADRDPAAEEAAIVADLDRAKQARARHDAAEARVRETRPPRAEITVQLDLSRPTALVYDLAPELCRLQGHSRKVARAVIHLGTAVGDKRVEIGRPDQARAITPHEGGQRDMSVRRLRAA